MYEYGVPTRVTGSTAAAASQIVIAGVLEKRIYLLALGYNPTTATAGLTKATVTDSDLGFAGATGISWAVEQKTWDCASAPVPVNSIRRLELAVTLTNGSAVVTSAALFTANMVGATVTGPGILPNTTVTVFTNASSITISNAVALAQTPLAATMVLRQASSATIDFVATGAGNTTGFALYVLGP